MRETQSRGIQTRQSLRTVGARTKEIVHDQLKRPRFEQIQANADKRDEQPEDRLPQKRSVVAEHAPVDRHLSLGLRIFVFRLN